MARTRICILGGSGFVGRHLAARFAALDFDITVLTRNAERHRALLVLPSVRLVQADVYNPEVLKRAFSGCDGVINLVGILNERSHRGRGFERAHVTLTQTVLDACVTAGVTRLLHMSALNATPSASSHYLRSKAEAARRVLAAQATLNVTVFEPSVIFGPDDSFLNRFAGLLRIAPVLPLACPRARFTPVFVGDVVQSFVQSYAMQESFGQRFCLCGPTEYNLRGLVKQIARAAQLRRRIIGLPRWASWLQAATLEWLPGKPFSLDNYHSLQVDSVCTENGLLTFGITPTPLEAMLPEFSGSIPR